MVGRAVDLIQHEPVYAEVFRYVFGDTLVFDTPTLQHLVRTFGASQLADGCSITRLRCSCR